MTKNLQDITLGIDEDISSDGITEGLAILTALGESESGMTQKELSKKTNLKLTELRVYIQTISSYEVIETKGDKIILTPAGKTLYKTIKNTKEYSDPSFTNNPQ